MAFGQRERQRRLVFVPLNPKHDRSALVHPPSLRFIIASLKAGGDEPAVIQAALFLDPTGPWIGNRM